MNEKLSFKSDSSVIKTAFGNDKLDRKVLAEKLTSYLDRLKDGAVLAIDAPWGEGKTWFGKNWAKHLKDKKHDVIYIDAFEQDYAEDPFMLITSEILDIAKDSKDDLKKSGAEVAKALLPTAAKVTLNLAGKLLLNSSDLSGDIQGVLSDVTSDTSEIASMLVKENLEAYSQNKKEIKNFKSKLFDYAKPKDKPIVIFIDELDRCKPDFAVKLIERVKHFFDVENIVFILLLNKEQLENAIKGVYGAETDASAYLGKFVNFFFHLPKAIREGNYYESKLDSFLESTMGKYKFQVVSHKTFIDHIKIWIRCFDMSLRDIEKAVALYSFSNADNRIIHILTYLIALKIKKPKHYKALISGNINAHKEAIKRIELFIKEEKEKIQKSLEFYTGWHEAYVNNFTVTDNFFWKQMENNDYFCNIETKKSMVELSKLIDLSIK